MFDTCQASTLAEPYEQPAAGDSRVEFESAFIVDACNATGRASDSGDAAWGHGDAMPAAARGACGRPAQAGACDGPWTRLQSRCGRRVGLLALSSSARGENSYAFGHDEGEW